MVKKRLIFVLYFDSGYFFLSRNFRLQRVGDVSWLIDKFRFASIGRFIDEIVILDVGRARTGPGCSSDEFARAVDRLMRQTFVPLTLGGGLQSATDAKRCFLLGADKVLINSGAILAPDVVRECVSWFGAQAVVCGIDAAGRDGVYETRLQNSGTLGLPLDAHLASAAALGVGEILLTSIDRDGTGTGFDLGLIEPCRSITTPLILSGGAGKPEHFAEALADTSVDAVATGHLFNFMGSGFELARQHLITAGYPVRQL